MERLKIFNGKLISNDEIIEDGCIVAEDEIGRAHV